MHLLYLPAGLVPYPEFVHHKIVILMDPHALKLETFAQQAGLYSSQDKRACLIGWIKNTVYNIRTVSYFHQLSTLSELV